MTGCIPTVTGLKSARRAANSLGACAVKVGGVEVSSRQAPPAEPMKVRFGWSTPVL